jgi:3-hydroxybutyrate dehydrogenase
MSLKGKVALITGSTSGIGLAMARAFAAQGCDIMLNGLGDVAAIVRLREAIASEFGVRADYHGADMTRPAEIADLVAAAKARLGRLDILVNNAGIQHVAPIEDFPPERWDAIIAINLSSSFHTIHHALPIMKAAGWGRIINVASTHGLVASGQKTAYVAAKHGLIGLTKAVAIECADTGITCNAVCPGWVKTVLVDRQIEAHAKQRGISIEDAGRALIAEKQPQLQFTTPEQIAGLAVFLASDTASNMQGTQLVSDGGWTAQ